jgi:hypothetical protein
MSSPLGLGSQYGAASPLGLGSSYGIGSQYGMSSPGLACGQY